MPPVGLTLPQNFVPEHEIGFSMHDYDFNVYAGVMTTRADMMTVKTIFIHVAYKGRPVNFEDRPEKQYLDVVAEAYEYLDVVPFTPNQQLNLIFEWVNVST